MHAYYLLAQVDSLRLGLSWLGLGNKLLAGESFAKANALEPKDWSSLSALRQLQREVVSLVHKGKGRHHNRTGP